mgnify:CR=1 FL=1
MYFIVMYIVRETYEWCRGLFCTCFCKVSVNNNAMYIVKHASLFEIPGDFLCKMHCISYESIATCIKLTIGYFSLSSG